MCSRDLALSRLEQAIAVFREHQFDAAQALPGSDDGAVIARILTVALLPPREYPARRLAAAVLATYEEGGVGVIHEIAACLARARGDVESHFFWLEVARLISSYEYDFDDEQVFPELLNPDPQEVVAAALFETGRFDQAVLLGLNNADEATRVYWDDVRAHLAEGGEEVRGLPQRRVS